MNFIQKRIIPTLLLHDESLVKTVQFDKFKYIGDPCNTVRIFNELEVDELLFLDIKASISKMKPNLKILKEIADECFMPLSYGGGITTVDDAKKIFDIGFEKISINSSLFNDPKLIKKISNIFGSQSVIGSIDVKKNFLGKYSVYSHSGNKKKDEEPVQWAKNLEKCGAGEILLTSINNEGMWSGFDIHLVKSLCDAVNIPVIANGGAGNISHLNEVFKKTSVSAVALGSMVVFQKKGFGVLINFPEKNEIDLNY